MEQAFRLNYIFKSQLSFRLSVFAVAEQGEALWRKKMLVRELGRRTAVNNDCLNAREILDAVIAACDMGQICLQGQHWINQHHSNHTNVHTRWEYWFTNKADPPSHPPNGGGRRERRKEGPREDNSVWERKMRSKEGEKGERDGEGAEKEDRRFNNSQTPASFRIEPVPKLDPRVLHSSSTAVGSLINPAPFLCASSSWKGWGQLCQRADMDFY